MILNLKLKTKIIYIIYFVISNTISLIVKSLDGPIEKLKTEQLSPTKMCFRGCCLSCYFHKQVGKLKAMTLA